MIFDDSQFWFSVGLQNVNWTKVLMTNAPFYTETQREIVLNAAGHDSINPLIIITSLVLEHRSNSEISTKGDKGFSKSIRYMTDFLADQYEKFDNATEKPKSNAGTSAIWKVLDEDNGKLSRFFALYQEILGENEISSKASFGDAKFTDRQAFTMNWPWPKGRAWVSGGTHSNAGKGNVWSSLDLNNGECGGWGMQGARRKGFRSS